MEQQLLMFVTIMAWVGAVIGTPLFIYRMNHRGKLIVGLRDPRVRARLALRGVKEVAFPAFPKYSCIISLASLCWLIAQWCL